MTVKCALCGFTYDPEQVKCSACPMAHRCHLTCCPNCGYAMPEESTLVKAYQRLKDKAWRKAKDATGKTG